MADQPRPPRTLNDARTEAEAAFKRTTTQVAEAPPTTPPMKRPAPAGSGPLLLYWRCGGACWGCDWAWPPLVARRLGRSSSELAVGAAATISLSSALCCSLLR